MIIQTQPKKGLKQGVVTQGAFGLDGARGLGPGALKGMSRPLTVSSGGRGAVIGGDEGQGVVLKNPTLPEIVSKPWFKKLLGHFEAFQPRVIEEVAGTWFVTHEPGFVYPIYPGPVDPLDGLDVYIGSLPMTDDPLPKLALAGTTSATYLHIKTTEQGELKNLGSGQFAELVNLANLNENSTHYELLNWAGVGTEGEYFFKLYETTLSGTRVIVNPAGPKAYGHFRWDRGYQQLKNLGNGIFIWRQNDVNVDEKQIYSIRGGIESEDPRDEIELTVIADTIVARGNNVQRTYLFDPCDGTTPKKMVFKDGLLTKESDANFTHFGECNDSAAP